MIPVEKKKSRKKLLIVIVFIVLIAVIGVLGAVIYKLATKKPEEVLNFSEISFNDIWFW